MYVESDIYRAIDMAFGWFKKNNPILETICDKQTLNEWYNFVTWCYAQDGEDMSWHQIEKFKKENNPNFAFEISPLMESAMEECAGWWCKYNIDHQEVAMQEMRDEMSTELDDYDYDEDPDGYYWDYYETAFNKISNSVDTSSFVKLSKIVL